MNAPVTQQSQILSLYQGMDCETRHKVLQLLIAELGYADDEADIFLSQAAWEMHPHNEDAQDRLYPIGCPTMEAARLHRIDIEKEVVRAERYAAGRSAMLHASLSNGDPQFFGSRFGG